MQTQIRRRRTRRLNRVCNVCLNNRKLRVKWKKKVKPRSTYTQRKSNHWLEEVDGTNNSRLLLSRLRLSGISAYLEVKIWSLFNMEILWKRGGYGEISPLFHIIYFRRQITYSFMECGCSIYFSSVLKIWFVEVRMPRSISESPLDFEITRVDCIWSWIYHQINICHRTGLQTKFTAILRSYLYLRPVILSH